MKHYRRWFLTAGFPVIPALFYAYFQKLQLLWNFRQTSEIRRFIIIYADSDCSGSYKKYTRR